jgi:hypothetical protein
MGMVKILIVGGSGATSSELSLPFASPWCVQINLFSESVSGFFLAAFARVEALGN